MDLWRYLAVTVLELSLVLKIKQPEKCSERREY
jgi:hypothetical protein